jgi:D-aminopeptidase
MTSETIRPPESLAAHEAFLRRLLAQDFAAEAPGAAIGILRGRESLSFGIGLARLDGPAVPFTPTTRFRACSLTKQFVALLLLQLEAEGRLTLKDHPGRHVPALAAFHPALNLLELAQNRSGLADYWCAAMLTGAQPETAFSLDDGKQLITSLPRQMFAPGAGTRYNNGNWRILQWVIEAASGQTLAELLRQRIFAPLGMQHSSLGEDTAAPLQGGTLGYRKVSGAWEQEITRIVWSGDAALVTTMEDLLKWEAAMLRQDPILGPTARLAEARPHHAVSLQGSKAAYAFGLNAWTNQGRRMHWHSGALRGFRMIHLRFPDEEAAMVVMLNRTANPMPYALAIAESLGLPPAWPRPEPADASVIGLPDPSGNWVGEGVDLVAEFSESEGHCQLNLGMDRQRLVRTDVDTLVSSDGFTVVQQQAADLLITSQVMGFKERFRRLAPGDARTSLAGRRFQCPELRSALHISADGQAVSFSGPQGESEIYALRPLGEGWLAFDCTRALDEAPPGRFHLRPAGHDSLIVSCLLAQGFRFTPAG